MKVEIWLEKSNNSVVIEADCTYQKGDMFCVATKGGESVYKYPLANIFCVKEQNRKVHVEASHGEFPNLPNKEEGI